MNDKYENRKKVLVARISEHKKEIQRINDEIELVEAQEKNPNLLPTKPKYYDGTIKKKRLYEQRETQYRKALNFVISDSFELMGGFDE